MILPQVLELVLVVVMVLIVELVLVINRVSGKEKYLLVMWSIFDKVLAFGLVLILVVETKSVAQKNQDLCLFFRT